MIDLLFDPNAWAALVTLTVLEIVLGIDNVIFISVLVSRCSPQEAKRARQIGLSLALIFRIILLFALTWLMALTYPIVTQFGIGISWRDIILIGGGLFLIAKATHEIHAEVEATDEPADGAPRVHSSFLWVVVQLIVVDLVFSLEFDHHRHRHGQGHRDHDRRRGDRHHRDVRRRPGRCALHRRRTRPPRCWRSRSCC